MLWIPLASRFTYSNWMLSILSNFSEYLLELQNTVIWNLLERFFVKWSTSVSQPPYLAGKPTVPTIDTFLIVLKFTHGWNNSVERDNHPTNDIFVPYASVHYQKRLRSSIPHLLKPVASKHGKSQADRSFGRLYYLEAAIRTGSSNTYPNCLNSDNSLRENLTFRYCISLETRATVEFKSTYEHHLDRPGIERPTLLISMFLSDSRHLIPISLPRSRLRYSDAHDECKFNTLAARPPRLYSPSIEHFTNLYRLIRRLIARFFCIPYRGSR